MFASRWDKRLSFSPHWLTNSQIVMAVADDPAGPYRFDRVVLSARGGEAWDGKMTHNPAIIRHGGRYVLFYTGTTYRGQMPTPDDSAPIVAGILFSAVSESIMEGRFHPVALDKPSCTTIEQAGLAGSYCRGT
jgi:hypothetical protein